MSELITKITQKDTEITAKLYIASLFALADGFSTDSHDSSVNEFSTDEVNNKVQKEINKQVARLLKNIDVDVIPNTSYDCIVKAKELIEKKKK